MAEGGLGSFVFEMPVQTLLWLRGGLEQFVFAMAEGGLSLEPWANVFLAEGGLRQLVFEMPGGDRNFDAGRIPFWLI